MAEGQTPEPEVDVERQTTGGRLHAVTTECRLRLVRKFPAQHFWLESGAQFFGG